MKTIASLSFLLLAPAVFAHGDHHSGPAEGETIQQYAQRHMSSEHHIDSFDTRSFHSLHDLNRDGVWDREEVEAVYGVHHIYSKKLTKDDEEHKKKADFISNAVFQRLDLNKDGFIDASELEKVGLDGLPNFDSIGAEGHHYDIESEFFLHHEEQFHSTPETQTDESYTHPEDLEHFAHHEAIEKQEAEREAEYQGISVEEVLAEQEKVQAEAAAREEQLKHEQEHAQTPIVDAAVPKVTRVTPPEKQDPSVRFKTAFQEGQQKGEWGSGEGGYKAPTAPGDKMRKNLPYKNRMQYKFRRNWGDF